MLPTPSAARRTRTMLLGLALTSCALAHQVRAQVTMVYYDFQDNAAVPTMGETSVDLSATPGATPVLRVGSTSTLVFVPGAFSFGLAVSSDQWSPSIGDPGVAATDFYEFEFSTVGLAAVRINFNDFASATGPGRAGLLFSTDGGATFTALATQATAPAFPGGRTFILPTAADGQARIIARIYAYADGRAGFSSTGTYAIDNLRVSATTVTSSIDLIDFLAVGFRTRGFPVVTVFNAFNVSSAGTTCRLGSTTVIGTLSVGSGATLDLNGWYLNTGGTTLTLNGSIAGSATTAPTSELELGATTVSGSGSIGSALDPLARFSMSTTGSVTLNVPAFAHATHLRSGTLTGSGAYTVAAVGPAPAIIEIGADYQPGPGGSFASPPTFALGSAGLRLRYGTQPARIVGFEMPPSRTLRSLDCASGDFVRIGGGMVDCDSVYLTSGTLGFDPGSGISLSDGGAIVATGGALAPAPDGGLVQFEGAATVSGAVTFQYAKLLGKVVDFGTASIVADSLELAGGIVAPGRAPTYGSSTLLRYSASGSIGDEWVSGDSGPHVPARVEIGPGSVTFDPAAASSPRSAPRSLRVWPGGTLALGSQTKGDLHVQGDLTVEGALVPNGRRVVFDGPGPEQHLRGGTSSIPFDVLEFHCPGRTLVHALIRVSQLWRITQGTTGRDVGIVGVRMAPGAALELTDGRFQLQTPTANTDTVSLAPALSFEGAGSVSGRADLSAVSLLGGSVDFSSEARVFGRLDMLGGSIANHHPPTYYRYARLTYADLRYPDTTRHVRGDEWSRYSGPAGSVDLPIGVHLDAGGADPTEPLTTQHDLIIDDEAIFDMNVPGRECTAPLTVGEDLHHRGTLVLSSLSGGDIHLKRNWWDGTLVSNGRHLFLDGTVRQTLRGTKSLGDVTVDNPAGVELSSDTGFGPNDLVVANQLHLVRGDLITNQNVVRVGAIGGVVRAGTGGHVIGNLQKLTGVGPVKKLTFDVGKQGGGPVAASLTAGVTGADGERLVAPGESSGYAPLEITLTDVTTEGAITVSTEPVDDPAIASSGFDPSLTVNRHWTVVNDGAVFASATIGAGFPAEDVDAGADPARFGVRVHDGSAWSIGAVTERAAQATEASGFAVLGRVAVGTPHQFAIDASAGAGGSVVPSGTILVDHGADQSFAITPASGFAVVDVLVDGSSVGAVSGYTFTGVTAPHTLTATFVAGNVAPVLTVPDSVSGSEGALIMFTATARDDDLPAQPLTFSLVPPTPAGATIGASSGVVEWASPDDALVTFRARVSDGQSFDEADVQVRARNVAPSATITAPAAGALVRLGQSVTLAGSYSDPGTADTHTASWELDGVPLGGVVNAATHTVSAVWTPGSAGVYSVRLLVTDDDGASGVATTVEGFDATVVVYDPNGGFVTGGGWIVSPEGAYTAEPTRSGTATFGFVAKYQKGASEPSGETEFQFKAASFTFLSTSYDWLVVSGAQAQYKGLGTVNGAGRFRFSLTAVDGALLGTGAADKLRLRVWDAASGGVVYDNQFSEPDDNQPVTVLGGGSIVIQKGGRNGGVSTDQRPVSPPTRFAVQAPAPNPSRGGCVFAIELPQSAQVTVTVHDIVGREVANSGGRHHGAGRVEWRWDATHRGGQRVAAGIYLARVVAIQDDGRREEAIRRVVIN